MATNNAANNGTAAAGKVLQGQGIGVASDFSTATYPSTAGTSGNVLTSDGTNWTSASSALPSGLSVATLTLTSLQIKSLHATPIQFIAAPGVGKTICAVAVWSSFSYGGTNVFTGGGAQEVSLYYGTLLVTTASLIPLTALSGTTSVIGTKPIATTGNPVRSTMQNIAIFAYNSNALEIGGNAANDNTITLTMLYYIATM